MAGYSGTPLPQKLGIKPGARVGLSKAPPDFHETLGTLPAGASVTDADVAGKAKPPFDVMVAFVATTRDLSSAFARLRPRLDPAGGLWIAWPKKKATKSSALPTDVTEALVRVLGLDTGLVDNKVCAIDETWSGLRFVVRVSDRPPRPKRSG